MPVHFKSQKQTCTAINMKMVDTEECMNKQFEQHVTHYWFVGKTILKSPSTEKKYFWCTDVIGRAEHTAVQIRSRRWTF